MPKKLNVYSADVKLCGTAYIRAPSAAPARRKLRENFGKLSSIEILADDIIISDRPLESPHLPEVSLSPAMTCYGQWGAPLDIAATDVAKGWDAE